MVFVIVSGVVVDQRTRSVIYSEDYAVVERILHFGRDLHAMAEQMKREYGDNETNNKALKVSDRTHGLFFISS